MDLTSLTFVATGRADLERGGRDLILLANKTKIFMLKYYFQRKNQDNELIALMSRIRVIKVNIPQES